LQKNNNEKIIKKLKVKPHIILLLNTSRKQGTYKVRNEIETKRNETKSTKTKRNEINKNETKRNEINETNESKTKSTKTKRNRLI
jgi:hypothetical protein